MDTEGLGGIVSSHMDEHAPQAIGGGFGAPEPMAGAPAMPTGGFGAPAEGAPGSLATAGKMLGAAGTSLAPSMAGKFALPHVAPAAPPAGTAPPMLAPLPAAPALAMSDRRAKTSIFDGGDDLDEVLQAVHEHLMRRGHR